MIVHLVEHIEYKKAGTYQSWFNTFLSYAMGGICFILPFDYCILTDSGKALVQKVKQEIKDCLSEVDFRSFLKPVLLLSGVYLLGILTIIRANFLYIDDIARTEGGTRGWYHWSRYISDFSSIFVHADTRLTDISPVPQLLAILILSISSVLLVYVIANKKITPVRLLASIPLGLSPYFLACLSFKFDAPYMALSILASIVPFLFIARKKAFLFCSVVSLLVMCMTYQAASGIYLMVAVIHCFQDWNSRKKSSKEILFFLGIVALSFCFVIVVFKFFLMISVDWYASTAIFPLPHIISGTLNNIKNYFLLINHDWGIIWKMGIALVMLFFIIRSVYQSEQKRLLSFFGSILVIGLSFVLSFGVYSLLENPLYAPRAMFGFGVFLSILCVYVVSGYKKLATVVVLALNWCLFVFAFSYGNALADQERYAEFRIGLLLHDLSSLYPNRNSGDMTFQLKNTIDYTPTIKNIAMHYPVIESLVPKKLGKEVHGVFWGSTVYYLEYFGYGSYNNDVSYDSDCDYDSLNLPVVLDSYYHTIKSDGSHVLIILKH